MHATHDVVIVGARCAGSATALLLARRGYDVALVDRSPMPQDTLSTHAIARSGIVQLDRWGLLDELLASGAPAIRTVSFGTAEGLTRREIKPTAGVDLLLAPRRYVLDTILRDAAVAAGATLHSPAGVRELTRHATGRITGVALRDGRSRHTLSARLVVGADGLRSTVAAQVAATLRAHTISPSGTFYSYASGLDADGFEFHLAPGALVGVFPTHGGQACLWICAPAATLAPLLAAGATKGDALLSLIGRNAPQLAVRLAAARLSAPVRGALQLPGQTRQAAGPGWALVGDAVHHRDPITGHGISDAFRDAELLADAIDDHLSGSTTWSAAGAAYEAERTAAATEIATITRNLTEFPALDRFTALQKQLSDAIEREALQLARRPGLRAGAELVA